MKEKIGVVLCVLALNGGCAEFQAAWPVIKRVIDQVADAGQLLSLVDSHARAHFRRHPNDDKLAEYERLFQNATNSLNLATRATQGPDALTDADERRAFADFGADWAKLERFLIAEGIMTPKGTLGAGTADAVTIRKPLAVR